ncbi:peptide-methionine (R)-S-oxide reductase [Micromonospora sp. NPDC050495]|uniref:peptide-methionine (R)-S-oxide reductase n=1 Tax=Micromonospora sp. NPDC050495 TaxID=3154936 RepID=UPI0033D88E04
MCHAGAVLAGRASPKPIATTSVTEGEDSGRRMIRTEACSLRGDSHLGHVFTDGPPDKGWTALPHRLRVVAVAPPRRPAGHGEYRACPRVTPTTPKGTT